MCHHAIRYPGTSIPVNGEKLYRKHTGAAIKIRLPRVHLTILKYSGIASSAMRLFIRLFLFTFIAAAIYGRERPHPEPEPLLHPPDAQVTPRKKKAEEGR
jgi:hypothetical protein